MWSSSTRWARVRRELRARIDSPRRAWLLLRMLGWWSGLACLRPFAPMRWLVRLATPAGTARAIQVTDVEQCILWLDTTGLWSRQGACLPRALVCRRFLSLAGMQPTLVVGFDGEAGHAWVEVDGVPYHERENGLFRAAFLARPGEFDLEKVAGTRTGLGEG